MCFVIPLRSLDSFLWLKRTFCLRHASRVGFAAVSLSAATRRAGVKLCERRNIRGTRSRLAMGGANCETDEGKCEVRTQIHLTDGGYFDAPVDYCKAKTLVIQQGTLVWK